MSTKTRARGTCPNCDKELDLTVAGKVPSHWKPGEIRRMSNPHCPGSDKKPAKVLWTVVSTAPAKPKTVPATCQECGRKLQGVYGGTVVPNHKVKGEPDRDCVGSGMISVEATKKGGSPRRKTKAKAKVKAVPGKGNVVIQKRFKESHPVRLTESEIVKRARTIAASHAKIKLEEEALRDLKADAKAQIEKETSTIERLLPVIKSGFDDAQVEVMVSLDFDADKKIWTRTDTGEIIRSVKIPPEDRQANLKLVNKARAAKGKEPTPVIPINPPRRPSNPGGAN